MNRLDRVDVVRTLVACVDRANVRLQSVAWTRAIDPTMTRAAQRLDMANARIESLSPARVLERGYAVVRTGAGVVVRDASSVRIGETVDIVVAKGRLAATVEGATLWPPSPDPLRNTVSEEAP